MAAPRREAGKWQRGGKNKMKKKGGRNRGEEALKLPGAAGVSVQRWDRSSPGPGAHPPGRSAAVTLGREANTVSSLPPAVGYK